MVVYDATCTRKLQSMPRHIKIKQWKDSYIYSITVIRWADWQQLPWSWQFCKPRRPFWYHQRMDFA